MRERLAIEREILALKSISCEISVNNLSCLEEVSNKENPPEAPLVKTVCICNFGLILPKAVFCAKNSDQKPRQKKNTYAFLIIFQITV
jgi:hypothetical protein